MTSITYEAVEELKEYLRGSLGLEDELEIQVFDEGLRISVPSKSLLDFGVALSAFFVGEEVQRRTEFVDLVSSLLTSLVEIEPLIEELNVQTAVLLIQTTVEGYEESSSEDEDEKDELDEESEDNTPTYGSLKEDEDEDY